MNRRTLLGLVLGIAALGLWFSMIDSEATLARLKATDLSYLGQAMLLYVGVFVVRAYRWHIFLTPLLPIRMQETYPAYMSGIFVNFISPLRVGELTKCLYLKKKYQISISTIFATVFIDRSYTLVSIFSVLAVIPFIPFRAHPVVRLALTVLGGGIIVAGIVAALISQTGSTDRVIGLLPARARGRAEQARQNFKVGFSVRPLGYRVLWLAAFLSLVIILVDAYIFRLYFQAVGFDIGLAQALVGMALLNILYIVPSAPGSIGNTEFYGSIVFAFGLGVAQQYANSAILLIHLTKGSVLSLIGLFCTWFLGIKLSELAAEAVD